MSSDPCSGAYNAALPIMLEDPGFSINGISLTADERELYYARGDTSTQPSLRQVVRRSRASTGVMFGAVEALPALDGVCGAAPFVNPDISEDGLTLYVTCTQDVPLGMSEGVSLLRVARRADRSADFTLEPEPIGSIFASAGISADELTAYTDGEVFDTAPQMFTRAAKTEPFGAAMPVPGIASALRSLDVSSDGLALFGATSIENVTRIVRAQRDSANASFAEPAPLELQLMPAVLGIGAPNVTANCSLYMVAILMDGQNAIFRAAHP